MPMSTESSSVEKCPVVVILGSGRSGTSLCGKILHELGVRIESTVLGPRLSNPHGFYEDKNIVDTNKSLLQKVSPIHNGPPKANVPRKEISEEIRALRNYIGEKVADANSMWAVKDPRISLLIPHYNNIFQDLGVIPKFILCVRDVEATVQSIVTSGNMDRSLAEQLYFIRTFLSLRDTALNCFVLHYEKLLSDPVTQITSLWKYLNKDENDSALPLSQDEMCNIVDEKLNRSSLISRPIENHLAQRVSRLIENMDGEMFDREFIFNEIKEIDGIFLNTQVLIDRISGKGIYDSGSTDLAEEELREERSEKERIIAEANREKNEFNTAIENLRGEVRVLNERLQQVQEEKSHFSNDLEKTTILLAKGQKEIERHYIDVENATKELVLFKRRHSALRKENSNQKGMLTKVRGQLDKCEKEKEKEKTRRLAIRGQLDKCEKDLSEKQRKLKLKNREIEKMERTYRFGRHIIDAFRRPGLNTIKLPIRIYRDLRGGKQSRPR